MSQLNTKYIFNVRHTLEGIFSFFHKTDASKACNVDQYPSVFSRVSYAMPWVRQVLAMYAALTPLAWVYDSKCDRVEPTGAT